MQKLVKEYLNELNRKQKKQKKAAIAALLLVILVVTTVVGSLTQHGVAMTGRAKCGQEEHQHSEACYTQELVCGQEETEGHTHTDDCRYPEELTCNLDGEEGHTHTDDCYTAPEGWACGLEETEGHTHMDDCYESNLTCGKEEHIHTEECYIDKEAGIEDAADWNAQYADVEWTNNWGEDLVTAAAMQMGYEESQDNYEVAEDGSHNGYTRFGEFAGEPYTDWDAAFVNFCIHYAGLEESNLFPETADSAKWQEEFNKIDEENSSYVVDATDCTPEPGDIVFQEQEPAQENEDAMVQMGIVSGYDEETGDLTVIEGDSGDSVKENQYNAGDEKIRSYLKINRLAEAQIGDQAAPVVDGTEGEQAIGNSENTYVKEFRMTGVIDGSSPFDDSPEPPKPGETDDTVYSTVKGKKYVPGDDEDAYNGIVRTFDTVQYGFHVEMASTNPKEQYKEACVLFKFVLPVSKAKAEFDLDAMSWLEPLSGEILKSKESDGEQVLTGKVRLKSTKNNVVPGSYESTVAVKIKNMQNEETLEPTFYAVMGNANVLIDEDIKWENPLSAGEVIVSAAPKYNVYVDGEVADNGTFDFNTGTKDKAANYGKGSFIGNALKVGVALQLYNDYPSKGMKGIQLPAQGKAITFQFDIDSKYTPDGGTQASAMNGYTPLLWSFDGSKNFGYGGKDQYNRMLNDYTWSTAIVPDNKYEEGLEKDKTCYNGGTWFAKQEITDNSSTVTVTVKDWVIDTEHMPKKSGLGTRDMGGANVGCFSAGEFVFIQPFNRQNSTSTAPYYDILNERGGGAGTFSTSITTDGKLKIEGIEKPYSSEEPGNKSVVRGVGVTTPGDFTNRVGFFEKGERWLSPGYTAEQYPNGHYGKGDGYILAGDKLELTGGFTYGANDKNGHILFGTNLMKFYGSKLRPTGEIRDTFGNEPGNKATLNGKGMELGENTFVFYAAKKDGTDWNSYTQMQHTYEKDLIFYSDINELEAEKKICVGILTCFIGPGSDEQIKSIYQVSHEAKVLPGTDGGNIGTTCELISTSRVWPEKTPESQWGSQRPEKHHPINLDDISLKNINKMEGLPQALRYKEYSADASDYKCYMAHLRSGNITARAWGDELETGSGSTAGDMDDYVGLYYEPTEYGEYGGITKPHNSDFLNWGDTVLILGYETKIDKSLMQKAEENGKTDTKTNFNLNLDQRVVDYRLDPSIYRKRDDLGKRSDQATTIIIKDTLPDYMEYIPGSARFGGTYKQASADGGQKGEIAGGSWSNQLEEEKAGRIVSWTIKDEKYDKDITVKQEIEIEGDHQVLIWRIENMPVGHEMEPIYYSVKISNNISKAMTNIPTLARTNKVLIGSTDDRRGNSDEKTIQVKLDKTTSHGKIVEQKIVEENGVIDYNVYFNSFMDTPQSALVVDRMPQDQLQVEEGTDKSEFDCNYTVSAELDQDSIDGVTVYYHTSPDVDINITDTDYEWEKKGWKKANIDSVTRKIGFGEEKPAAWAAFGTLNLGESIRVKLSIELAPGNPKQDSEKTNTIVNFVKGTSQSGSSVVTTKTVRRSLEGLAWLDDNHDGLRDDSEKLLSGVSVQLLTRQLKPGSGKNPEYEYVPFKYDGTEEPVVIQTGQQVSIRSKNTQKAYEPKSGEAAGSTDGCYRFMDLPPGTYAVQFTLPDGMKTSYKATAVNAGDDMKDSDAEPEYRKDTDGKEVVDENGNKELLYTQISDLVMPDVKEIEANGGSTIYRSEHNDSGFYPNSGLNIQKTDKNGDALSGAIFIIKGKDGKAVSFTKNSEGNYMMPDSETGGQPDSSEPERFVIALFGDEDQVMGVKADNGVVQQRKEGASEDDLGKKYEIASSQLFEIYDAGDGYKAVKSAASEKWFGLDEDNLIDGVPAVKMLDNPDNDGSGKNPPADKKFHWRIRGWQEGDYDMIPRSYQKYSVGIGDNGSIQLGSSTNDVSPQRFSVVPAAKHKQTTKLKVDETGKLIINNLMSGTSYTIEEIRSPNGYRILSQPGEITVDNNGGVTLTGNSNGNITHQNSSDSQDRNAVLKLNIRNNELYELPSAGGIGTYWYTIGGMLLMLAAALILYKNKCKEVLDG